MHVLWIMTIVHTCTMEYGRHMYIYVCNFGEEEASVMVASLSGASVSDPFAAERKLLVARGIKFL